jgi:hypothetical protein
LRVLDLLALSVVDYALLYVLMSEVFWFVYVAGVAVAVCVDC